MILKLLFILSISFTLNAKTTDNSNWSKFRATYNFDVSAALKLCKETWAYTDVHDGKTHYSCTLNRDLEPLNYLPASSFYEKDIKIGEYPDAFLDTFQDSALLKLYTIDKSNNGVREFSNFENLITSYLNREFRNGYKVEYNAAKNHKPIDKNLKSIDMLGEFTAVKRVFDNIDLKACKENFSFRNHRAQCIIKHDFPDLTNGRLAIRGWYRFKFDNTDMYFIGQTNINDLFLQITDTPNFDDIDTAWKYFSSYYEEAIAKLNSNKNGKLESITYSYSKDIKPSDKQIILGNLKVGSIKYELEDLNCGLGNSVYFSDTILGTKAEAYCVQTIDLPSGALTTFDQGVTSINANNSRYYTGSDIYVKSLRVEVGLIDVEAADQFTKFTDIYPYLNQLLDKNPSAIQINYLSLAK